MNCLNVVIGVEYPALVIRKWAIGGGINSLHPDPNRIS
jgi:hypothetical protein